MNFATVFSRANCGMDAPLVVVETHLMKGLPSFSIVGLPETSVKESKDRVRSALINAGFEFPMRRITVNLAPADIPKVGSRFDLPIAISILIASGQLKSREDITSYELYGELALDGALRTIHGVLPMAMAAYQQQHAVLLPKENANEAALINDLEVLGANSLLQICEHLSGHQPIAPKDTTAQYHQPQYPFDFSEIHGQGSAKRALEIAASGGHSLLMVGPPGTGKTMLATRLTTILPPLNEKEALEVASIHSVSGHGLSLDKWRTRPFRSPHHTASSVALVGGGRTPKPGEISLAHRGILFLDELPEFNRNALETLREPLESGKVSISRAAFQVEYPAKFQLIAAMNPCPCGYLTDPNRHCRCTEEQIQRYQNKLSGPFLDRIDMFIQVPALPISELIYQSEKAGESSNVVAKRVTETQEVQNSRQGKINCQLSAKEMEHHSGLPTELKTWLVETITELKLSARAYHRLMKVARTIADMDHEEKLSKKHLLEALSYRQGPSTFTSSSTIEESYTPLSV